MKITLVGVVLIVVVLIAAVLLICHFEAGQNRSKPQTQ